MLSEFQEYSYLTLHLETFSKICKKWSAAGSFFIAVTSTQISNYHTTLMSFKIEHLVGLLDTKELDTLYLEVTWISFTETPVNFLMLLILRCYVSWDASFSYNWSCAVDTLLFFFKFLKRSFLLEASSTDSLITA